MIDFPLVGLAVYSSVCFCWECVEYFYLFFLFHIIYMLCAWESWETHTGLFTPAPFSHIATVLCCLVCVCLTCLFHSIPMWRVYLMITRCFFWASRLSEDGVWVCGKWEEMFLSSPDAARERFLERYILREILISAVLPMESRLFALPLKEFTLAVAFPERVHKHPWLGTEGGNNWIVWPGFTSPHVDELLLLCLSLWREWRENCATLADLLCQSHRNDPPTVV